MELYSHNAAQMPMVGGTLAAIFSPTSEYFHFNTSFYIL